MKSVSVLCTCFLVAFALLPEAQAQDVGGEPEGERPLLEQVRALKLDSLQRGTVTVHFSPGYRDQANQLGARTHRALQFFSDSLGTELDEFHLIMPAEADWTQLAELPYGFPIGLGGWWSRNIGDLGGLSDHPPATIVPPDGRGVVFEQLLALEECVSPEHRKRLKEVGHSWEEAARRYVELITFHEVGHSVHRAYEIARSTSWFNEFLANYFGYAYLLRNEPEFAPVWDLMSAVTVECYTPTQRTLAHFELPGKEASSYHWYQSHFIQHANRVVENHGFDFIRKARAAFPAESSKDSLTKKVDALYNNLEALSEEEALHRVEAINEEVLRRLKGIAPGFQAWAERFERDESP